MGDLLCWLWRWRGPRGSECGQSLGADSSPGLMVRKPRDLVSVEEGPKVHMRVERGHQVLILACKSLSRRPGLLPMEPAAHMGFQLLSVL